MNRLPVACVAFLVLFGSLVFPPNPVSAQENGRYLSLGLSAGGGLVQTQRLDDAWKLGPVFGGRFEWSRGTSAAWLMVDAQPFRAERTSQEGDFRALYIIPAFAFGSPSRRFALGLGAGVFDFSSELEESDVVVGMVISASGAFRVARSSSVELGWKRIRNVNGLRANVYTLQLVQQWRF